MTFSCVFHLMSRTLIVLCLFLLFSCSSNNNSKAFDDIFEEADSLNYSEMLFKDYLWGTPMDMMYLDSSLFVFDERNESGLFHVIELDRLDSIHSFGEKGQGDNEFVMPFDFQLINNTVVGVFDLANKSLYPVDLREVKRHLYKYPIYAKDTIANTIKLIPTIYNTFVAQGFYDDCVFKLWGSGMNEIRSYGEYPYKDADEKSIENRLRGMAYQGMIRSNPSRNKFVYAVKSANIIYFYEINPKDLVLVKKYEYNYPKYITKVQGDARSAPMAPDNNKTFISLCTSERYVYALYSGKNFKSNGLEAFSGNIMYVFDWSGKPIKKFVLNASLTQICVNRNDRELFGFSNMREPVILKFRLNKF